MLTITIPKRELYDRKKREFIQVKEQTLQLEHSLVSLSKWESKWCKPYFSKEQKTYAETIDYIKCMTITQNVNPDVYFAITKENIDDINRYIDSPMTATTVSGGSKGKLNGQRITSELIYYWMVTLNIWKECEKWHLNRLIALIKVCNAMNQPSKKTNPHQTAKDYAALNAMRRKKLNTKG